MLDKLPFLFHNGEQNNEAISLYSDNCFLVLDWLLKLEARGGDSVILVSPELQVSSSVLWDSPPSSSGTALGEGFSFLVSKKTGFWTGEAALSLWIFPFDHLKLDWWLSAKSDTLEDILIKKFVFLPRIAFLKSLPSECGEFVSRYCCSLPHFPIETIVQLSGACSKQYLVALEVLVEKEKWKW